jgi:acetyl esterase/lipase
MCRDAKIRLRLAVLAIPVTTDFSNISDPKDAPFDSYREFQDGALLNWERLSYFGANLFPKDRDAVRASLPRLWLAPLEAENFKDLCDTFVITAECDPMRDEGEAYVMKVVEAGLKVMFKR